MNVQMQQLVRPAILPMTPAQRAQIRIIDLANPPPFIRVVRRVEDLREVSEDDTPGISHWLYVHDWGDLANMFDTRRTARLIGNTRLMLDNIAYIHRKENGIKLISDIDDYCLRKAEQVFATVNAESLIKEVVTLAGAALGAMTSLNDCDVSLRFEQQNTFNSYHKPLTQVHQDSGGSVRAFFVTEHQNMIIPDTAAALDKGFDFAARSIYVTELIDADVPVYAAPLRTVPFVRFEDSHCNGRGLPSWHAVHEMRPDVFCRPCFTLDFD